jgi:L-asparaginase
MTLRIIATGGTFDKRYDEIAGELRFGESHLADIIKRARLTLDVTIELLTLQDSLDMGDADRARILASCRAASELAIVVVHGTDTMRETAMVLGAAPELVAAGKRVILTGSMVPYDIDNSDALFNLGFACAAAQLAAPGIQVAMNGQLFGWDAVHKNRALGRFELPGTDTATR